MSINRQSPQQESGFTLIELMIVISIIAILASFALPSYLNYVNKAKAAEVSTNIHQIALTYIDAAYQDKQGNLKAFDSPSIGAPPPAFTDKAGLYKTDHGFTLGSYVMGANSALAENSLPLVLIKAPNNDKKLLHALDSILAYEHSYLTPDIIAIKLTASLASSSGQSSAGAGAGTAAPQPNNQNTAANLAANTAGTTSGSSGSGTGTTGSGSSGSGSSGSGSSGSGSSGSGSSSSSSSSTTPNCQNAPKGWIKNHLHGC
jgi:prepilin-type N-terminal cleavage/methylation domain-containing protein